MSYDIYQLIQLAQSSNNVERNNAENTLLELADSDASSILTTLMDVATDNGKTSTNVIQSVLTSRQFALLTIRKLITFYWSPAFESYRNTSSLDPDTKTMIRDSLLKLSLDPNQDTKLYNSASYCIVQIAAVDFPDQWPQLLPTLYNCVTDIDVANPQPSLNAISILNEIYDDIISEDMFFDGGIGIETLKIVSQLSVNINSQVEGTTDSLNVSVKFKVGAMKLFNACLLQMSAVTSNSSSDRKHFVKDIVLKSLEMLSQMLLQYCNNFNKLIFQLKSLIYQNLVLLKSDFPVKLFPNQWLKNFKERSVQDLSLLKDWYLHNSEQLQLDDTLWQQFNEYAIQILEFLSLCNHTIQLTENDHSLVLQSMLTLSCLNDSTRDTWLNDPNEFISKESGVSANYTIRDQVADYLSNLSGQTLQITFQNIVEYIMNHMTNNTKLLESSLYMLQCVLIDGENNPFTNEDIDNDKETGSLRIKSINEFESFIDALFMYQFQSNDPLLASRIILLVPKLLDNFMNTLPNVKLMTTNYLIKSVERGMNIMLQDQDNGHLILCSILIAFTYYSYYAELSSILNFELCSQVQLNLLKLVNYLSQDAEEDTNGLLIEVLNNIINCNSESTDFKIVRQEFTSVLSISSKDPSNIQIVVESQDCLEKLLANITTERYVSFMELCLPSFIHIIQGNATTRFKYSPLLSLILEFITVFMKKKPTDGPLPTKFCEYIWEPLIQILQTSVEDEVLQLSTDAFTYLIHNTDREIIKPQLSTIVNILERLLSMDVSDTAAMNVGSLIVTICGKFNNELSDLIPQILKAAVNRLINVKHITTQENLVSLLCFLTYNDPLQTLNFLFEMSMEQQQESSSQVHLNVVQTIFNKWFETFEIIRGERKIKDNVIALSKIFFLSDTRLHDIIVNGELIPYDGDLIITRSMAKKMPDRYTQVNVYTKIVKLFCNELEYRTRKTNPEKYITSDIKHMDDMSDNNIDSDNNMNNAGDNADDDEWEDVDDVLDYEKLKEYIDDDDDDDDEAYHEDTELNPEQAEAQEITGIVDVPQSLVQLLVEFFKEATTSNVNGFQNIYNSLNDNEKAVLTQNLV